ncbi:hypothetical protein Trco_004397 [Trichoderma cornu-damae]|uniref:Phenylalanine--tRNA ligase, mitochondrial n=1 Tax=Trichoderma cornu-damae TaxID=654480 RepID=A0A9P8QMY2_9HYPO|nr:hypothetical protein Trco_004397 [Trichoderma cornu-damae]
MSSARIGSMRCFVGLSTGARQRSSRPRALRRGFAHRFYSAASSEASAATVTVRGEAHPTEKPWFNVPPNIISKTARRLHLQEDHPIYITRRIIESHFPRPTYEYYNEHSPVVTTAQNFDSLGFPADHPGRALSDTYYLNQGLLLRTHTSAHQADTFRANRSDGYLISADVYRRDAIDRSHYPIFHQMEGARSWDRSKVPRGDVAAAVLEDVERLPKHGVAVEDPNPPTHPERNPLQEAHHSAAEAEALARHLKRSLENTVVDIFTRARAAATTKDGADVVDEPLRMRWVEAYFPFTSPSWELEVYYAGDWLEVLGCGVVKQELYINAGVPSQVGWAFGVGIDRIAMLLFKIPDIRLFWSEDRRFLSQFTGVSANLDALRRFVPFSKHPPSSRDVSFWIPSTSAAGGDGKDGKDGKGAFHENDVMELVRSVGGDEVESVNLIDEFVHPETGRKSVAYRIVYRSLERTLTGKETKALHERVRKALVRRLGVELR